MSARNAVGGQITAVCAGCRSILAAKACASLSVNGLSFQFPMIIFFKALCSQKLGRDFRGHGVDRDAGGKLKSCPNSEAREDSQVPMEAFLFVGSVFVMADR